MLGLGLSLDGVFAAVDGLAMGAMGGGAADVVTVLGDAVPTADTVPGVDVDVTGVRLRDVTGPWGRFGGSCDLAPYSTYCKRKLKSLVLSLYVVQL